MCAQVTEDIFRDYIFAATTFSKQSDLQVARFRRLITDLGIK